MFELFTDRARRVIVLSQNEARELGHNYIGTEHLLLGLVHEQGGVAAAVFESLGISLGTIRDEVEELVGTVTGHTPEVYPPFTPRAKKALEMALREALILGHDYIGTEHLLLGLVREGEGRGAQILERHTSLATVRTTTVEVLNEHRVIPSTIISRLLVTALPAEEGTTRLLVEMSKPMNPEELQRILRAILT